MLLLVDNDQAQLLELNRFREQCMGADDDIDQTLSKAFLGFLDLRRRNQPRQPPNLDREALEALDEIGEMLAHKQCSGTNQRDLQPGHRRHERRP